MKYRSPCTALIYTYSVLHHQYISIIKTKETKSFFTLFEHDAACEQHANLWVNNNSIPHHVTFFFSCMFLRARRKRAHNPTIIMLCVCVFFFIILHAVLQLMNLGYLYFFYNFLDLFDLCVISLTFMCKWKDKKQTILDLCHSLQKIGWFFYGMAIKFKFIRILFIN